jgi:hypothetical protein
MSVDINNYEKQAAARWGETDAFQEYREKSKRRSAADNDAILQGMMNIFREFAEFNCSPSDDAAQELVKKLQDYITKHFYTCTNEILAGLGKMYAADGEFKTNIDRYAGEGIAEFVSKAIEVYTK